MNYVFLRYVFLSDCDVMMRRKEKTRFGRKSKKTSVGVKIPQACSNCAWKENRTTIAKIKCNNKDAEVLQENGEWMCYSFTTHVPRNKKNII